VTAFDLHAEPVDTGARSPRQRTRQICLDSRRAGMTNWSDERLGQLATMPSVF
jgi:hypothetical protein